MGFNSTVVILNDRLHEIETEPKRFVEGLSAGIRTFGYPPNRTPWIVGQTQVVSVAHADTGQLISVGGNCGNVVGHFYARNCGTEEASIEILKQVAGQLGYNLVKKRKKK